MPNSIGQAGKGLVAGSVAISKGISKGIAHPTKATAVLSSMKVRKKLIVLHTVFSLLLATVLVIVLRPAVSSVIQRAEEHEARLVMALLEARLKELHVGGFVDGRGALEKLGRGLPKDVPLVAGSAAELAPLGVDEAVLKRLGQVEGEPIVGVFQTARTPMVVGFDRAGGVYFAAKVQILEARAAVTWLYVLLVLALLAVYGLIAMALEVFVLPTHVYGPIRAMLKADQAVATGRRHDELIDERQIPGDELGQIMRSRNATVEAMRRNEAHLSEALKEIERSAADLQKKNLLIEAAQRNLADADRLVSLGVLSAGLAHEMNTPLSVIKGLVEKLARHPQTKLEPGEAALLLRVVGRLERLGESLLDFARVRPPESKTVELQPLIDEAWTLVRLDRDAAGSVLKVGVPSGLMVTCDSDRMIQVFVNLLRNAVDAHSEMRFGSKELEISVRAEKQVRDQARWVSIVICDQGPGLKPEVLAKLFEPFSSTRLDSHGTGLGLAVSLGIVREHNGLLVGRNRVGAVSGKEGKDLQSAGAEFEILLPDVQFAESGRSVGLPRDDANAAHLESEPRS